MFRPSSVYEEREPVRIVRKWLPYAEYKAEKEAMRERIGWRPAPPVEREYHGRHLGNPPARNRQDVVLEQYRELSRTSTVAIVFGNFDNDDLGHIQRFVRRVVIDMGYKLRNHVEFQTKLQFVADTLGKTKGQVLNDIAQARWPMVYKWKLAGPPFDGLRSAVNALWRANGSGGF